MVEKKIANGRKNYSKWQKKRQQMVEKKIANGRKKIANGRKDRKQYKKDIKKRKQIVKVKKIECCRRTQKKVENDSQE